MKQFQDRCTAYYIRLNKHLISTVSPLLGEGKIGTYCNYPYLNIIIVTKLSLYTERLQYLKKLKMNKKLNMPCDNSYRSKKFFFHHLLSELLKLFHSI